MVKERERRPSSPSSFEAVFGCHKKLAKRKVSPEEVCKNGFVFSWFHLHVVVPGENGGETLHGNATE
jgi:hypothetical protein